MDENNLDPEQLRQLNEAFGDLQNAVKSTTEKMDPTALKKNIDKTAVSVDKLKSEFDKLTKSLQAIIAKTSSNIASSTTSGVPTKTNNEQQSADVTTAFGAAITKLSGNFSGLNSVTINLIKSFQNLTDLASGTKKKISQVHRERTERVLGAVDLPVPTPPPMPPAPVVPIPTPAPVPPMPVSSAPQAPTPVTPEPPNPPAPVPPVTVIPAPVQPSPPAPVSPTPEPAINLELKNAIEAAEKRLKDLEKSLDESSKTILRNTGYIKDSSGKWVKYNSELENLIQLQQKVVDPLDRQIDALEEEVKSYGYVKKIREDGTTEWIKLTKELTKEQEKDLMQRRESAQEYIKEGKARKDAEEKEKNRRKASEQLTTNFTELGKVLGKDFTKHLFDSSRGMSKYGETVSKFGDGIIDATKNLGPLGKYAGLAAGSLFKLVGASLKQNEALNQAYERLSEFGAVDFSGIKGMFASLQNAGFTVAEIGKFGDILQSVSPNLATLGMTAAEGAKRVSDTFSTIKNTGVERSLRMLGYNSETLFKTFANYEGLMGRLGFAQNKSVSQMAKESAEYAKTLDELTKLTGQSRDELQRRMDADANDIKFRLRLQEVDENTRKRFQKASALMGEFSEDTASGFREMLANSGDVVGEASTKLMLSTGNKARDIVLALEKGEISAVEANRRIAMAKAEEIERYRRVGKIDADIMRELGITVKDMDAINKYRGKTQQEMEELDKQNKLQMEGQLDSQRAAEVARIRTERNFEQAKDRVLQLVGVQVASAFEKLLTIVNSLGKGLANFVKFITFGKVDFTDLFESVDDITNKLKGNEKELSETTKKIAEIKTAQDRYLLAETKSAAKDEEVRNLELQIEKESNKEARAELEKKLDIARKEARILGDERTQARLDFNKRSTELPKLEEKKTQLEKTKTSLEKKQQEMGGAQTVDTESPAMKKLNEEADSLLKKQNTLKEIIADKFGNIRDDAIKNSAELSKLSKEELEKEENIKKINEAIVNEKQRFIKEQKDIEKRLAEIGKERLALEIAEVDGAKKQAETRPTGAAPIAPAQASPMQASNQEFYDKIYKTLYEQATKAKVENPEAIARLGAAQSALETGYGKSTAGGNNYFGIKGKKGDTNVSQVDTQEWDPKQGKMVTVKAGFRKYESMEESAADYVKFLQENKRYKEVLAAKTPLTAISAQGLTGYATDPNYAAKLQSIHLSAMSAKDATTTTAGTQPPKTAEVQQGKFGGMFTGPESGYPVLLHGKEIVIPMPDMADLKSQLNDVKKTDLASIAPVAATPATDTGSDSLRDILAMQGDMINILTSKLDTMIDKLNTGNDIQDRLLTYSLT